MRFGAAILGLSTILLSAACGGAPQEGGAGEADQTAEVQSPLEATGSVQFYMSVSGKKQGVFINESTAKGYAGQPSFRFSMGVTSPTSPTSGQPSGKQVLEDVKITKAFGASDPQFLQAIANNEALDTVTFTFVKSNLGSGVVQTWQTVKLTNAQVDGLERSTLELDDANKTSMLADQISFRYESLTLTDANGNVTSTITR